ncbi:MAG: hypothetical protein DRP78_07465, partial [Candidatus Omnitrophota bacterium]
GQIQTITVSWKFKGKVTLEISADDGRHYTQAVNGVPLNNGFVPGNQLKWKVKIGKHSSLFEVKIVYTDTSGVVGSFGTPELSNFKYRQQLKVTNASRSELFNFQVKVKVSLNADQSEDAQMYCYDKIRDDFRDIRFTACDGETLLPYYLENISNGIAHFWVKVPQIPAQGVNIYAYYGNVLARDLSCPESVFDFFDDFNFSGDGGECVNLKKWNLDLGMQGECVTFDSSLQLKSAAIISKEYQFSQGIIECRAKTEQGKEALFIVRTNEPESADNALYAAYASAYDDAQHCLAIEDIVKSNDPKSISEQVYYDFRIIFFKGNLKFERIDANSEVQALAEVNDLPDTERGFIGIKAGHGKINIYDWIRTRKYVEPQPLVEITDELEQTLDLPVFKNTTLAENGDLCLSGGAAQGTYISKQINLLEDARIIGPVWQKSLSNALDSKIKISLDFSTRSGQAYTTDRVNGKYYYASKQDFQAGDKLKYQLRFSTVEKSEKNVRCIASAGLDCSAGKITLVYPNGGEVWKSGTKQNIIWSALDYGSDYNFKIEYSLDNGSSFELIAQSVENTGQYVWRVPEKFSDKVLLRICDALSCESVFDTTDACFAIKEPGTDTEETQTQEPLAEDVVSKTQNLNLEKLISQGQRPETKLYELLVKLGDNHSKDPEEDTRSCYKEGDIVLLKLAGHKWTKTERNSFLIVPVYLTKQEADLLIQPKIVITSKHDKQGNPIAKTIKRRATRINLQKLGISQGSNKEQTLRKLRNTIAQESDLAIGKVLEKK